MTRTKVLIFPSFDRRRVTAPEFYLPPRVLLLFFLPYGSESCFSDRYYRIICMVTPESKIETRFLREQWLFKDGKGEIVVLLSQMHKGNINKDNIDGVNMKSFPIKEVTSNGRRNLGIQRQEGCRETVRSDNGGTVSTSDPDGQGTSRLLEEVQKEDVQGNGGRGDAAAADKRGRTPERLGDGTDAANRACGGNGNGEVGDIRRDVGISDGGRTDGGGVTEAERIFLISKKQGYCGAT